MTHDDPNDLHEPDDPNNEALDAIEDERDFSAEIADRWDPKKMLGQVSQRAGRSERLDESTRRKYERKLGADFGDVRIYTGEFAEEVTKAHRAEALTIGNTGMILMGGSPGKAAGTRAGSALLAHELTHVAQGQRGVHRKGTFSESTPLAHEEHEAEAEAIESEEMQGGSAEEEANKEENDELLFQLVRARVMDMFAEQQRNWLMRNGDDIWRP